MKEVSEAMSEPWPDLLHASRKHSARLGDVPGETEKAEHRAVLS